MQQWSCGCLLGALGGYRAAVVNACPSAQVIPTEMKQRRTILHKLTLFSSSPLSRGTQGFPLTSKQTVSLSTLSIANAHSK